MNLPSTHRRCSSRVRLAILNSKGDKSSSLEADASEEASSLILSEKALGIDSKESLVDMSSVGGKLGGMERGEGRRKRGEAQGKGGGKKDLQGEMNGTVLCSNCPCLLPPAPWLPSLPQVESWRVPLLAPVGEELLSDLPSCSNVQAVTEVSEVEHSLACSRFAFLGSCVLCVHASRSREERRGL